jgi:hypothetical protein
MEPTIWKAAFVYRGLRYRWHPGVRVFRLTILDNLVNVLPKKFMPPRVVLVDFGSQLHEFIIPPQGENREFMVEGIEVPWY